MTDEEVSSKLRVFSGAERGLDKKTEEVVGKLLVDEKDENVDADKETFGRLYEMIGGAFTLGTLGITITVFKYFEVYKRSLTFEWSDASPEEQASKYTEYTSRIAFVGLLGLVLHKIKDIIFTKVKRAIGRDVHRVTLRRVLLAPVNTFFDVTPLGKIVNIFMSNLNVFYGQVLDAPRGIFEMLSHVMVVFSMLFAIGNWYMLVPMVCMMLVVGRKIAKPYTYADN